MPSEQTPDILSQLKDFAVGFVKGNTTDLVDVAAMTPQAQVLGAIRKAVGSGEKTPTGDEIFKQITGIEPTGGIAETIGSFLSPGDFAKAMIVGAARVNKVAGLDPSKLASVAEKAFAAKTPEARADLFLESSVYKGQKDDVLRTIVSDIGMKINPETFFASRLDVKNPAGGQTNTKALHYVMATDIGKAVDHPVLFKYYPELKDIKLDIAPGKPGEGYFNPSKNVIGLAGVEDLNQVKSVILHELQHAVQRIEGMAPGASSSEFKKQESVVSKLGKKLQDPTISETEKAAAERFMQEAQKKSMEAYNRYANVPGEQEARFTQATEKMNRNEIANYVLNLLRRGESPQTTFTVPIRPIP
jgi:hypothetical protein